jgi:hypothetical protein
VEVPVNWTEIPGSKINLIESSFLMARDLVLIRGAYTVGVWRATLWPDITRTLLHANASDANAIVRAKDPHVKDAARRKSASGAN